MAERSFGVVVPATGPVRATSNELDPTAAVWVHSYRVQHMPSNSSTGRGYVGNKDLNGINDGTYGIVPSLSDAPPWPVYESPSSHVRDNPFNMADIYIDCDVRGDQYLVTGVQV